MFRDLRNMPLNKMKINGSEDDKKQTGTVSVSPGFESGVFRT